MKIKAVHTKLLQAGWLPVSCHPTVLVLCPEVWSGHETTTVYGIMLLVLPDETGSYLFTSPDLSLQFQPPEAASKELLQEKLTVALTCGSGIIDLT